MEPPGSGWTLLAWTYAVAAGTTALLLVLAYVVLCQLDAAVPIEVHVPEEAQPGWKGELVGDANAVFLPGGQIQCHDPATGYRLAEVHADMPASIERKIAKAAAAQQRWKQTTFRERRRVLKTLLAWLQSDMEAIARVACRDTGKTVVDAAFGELLTTTAKLAWTIRHGEGILRTEKRSGNILLAHKRCLVMHEPLGVVAACVSWNYPVHNILGPIIASIFSGNAIVVKCSEHVAWSSKWVERAVRSCISACGHSPDLVQLVACEPAHAEALTRSPHIAHLTFIGSDAVGAKVAAAAATQLTATTLELGGKDPAVILPGVDLHFFSSMCACCA